MASNYIYEELRKLLIRLGNRSASDDTNTTYWGEEDEFLEAFVDDEEGAVLVDPAPVSLDASIRPNYSAAWEA